MIRRIIFLTLLSLCAVNASLFDFIKKSAIDSSYSNRDYNKTLKVLQTLHKTAIVHYDIGNILYKLGRYGEAVVEYKRAFGDGVDEHSRLHNLGNSYLQLGQYDNAITAYNVALKLKDDASTKYNLDRAKKQKIKPKEEKKQKKKSQQTHKSKNKEKEKSSDSAKKDKKDKKAKKEQKKLTKRELKQLEAMRKKAELKKELKKMMKNSFKDKKVPVIMYKLDTKAQKDVKP